MYLQNQFAKLKNISVNTRLLVTYILNVFDWVCTTVFVNMFGTEIEGNTLMRYAFENGLVNAYKLIGVAILCAILYYFKDKYTKLVNISSWIVFSVYSALAIYHLVIIMKLLTIFL